MNAQLEPVTFVRTPNAEWFLKYYTGKHHRIVKIMFIPNGDHKIRSFQSPDGEKFFGINPEKHHSKIDYIPNGDILTLILEPPLDTGVTKMQIELPLDEYYNGGDWVYTVKRMIQDTGSGQKPKEYIPFACKWLEDIRERDTR